MPRISLTWKTRYDGLGITDYIYQHFKHADKKLVIVDVGCSNGMALTGCKDRLSSKRLEVYAVGIDPYEDKADKSDIDEFIQDHAANVLHQVGKADVVICVNVINESKWAPKSVFQDAAKFLKIGGVMITDADGVPTEYENGLNPRSDFRVGLCCLKYDAKNLINIGRKMHVYKKTK